MDGYVLARSAFSHTINYRSAMVFGTPRVLTDLEEKTEALRTLTNGLFPERWEALRPVDVAELNAASVLCMDIDEATVKSRAGPPADVDEAHVPVWSGVIPVINKLGTPEPSPELPVSIALPETLEALVASGRLRGIE
jgi:Predicted flavin-nucleotide-binding protein